MRYSIAAASLFSTSALAVLYPGQSNVNHTCQLSEYGLCDSNERLLMLYAYSQLRRRFVLLQRRQPQYRRFVLRRNIRRTPVVHPVLVYLHWT
jgi:hypothetical protein